MTLPSIGRSGQPGACRAGGERYLISARGPENTTPREAEKLAAYSVQIDRSRRSCNRLRCSEDALQTVPLGRLAECALRKPLRRSEGVPCGTDVMRPPYARVMCRVNILVNRHQVTTIA